MPQKLYIVANVVRKSHVNISDDLGIVEDIKIEFDQRWATGMVGVAPIFGDRQSAENYVQAYAEAFGITEIEKFHKIIEIQSDRPKPIEIEFRLPKISEIEFQG